VEIKNGILVILIGKLHFSATSVLIAKREWLKDRMEKFKDAMKVILQAFKNFLSG